MDSNIGGVSYQVLAVGRRLSAVVTALMVNFCSASPPLRWLKPPNGTLELKPTDM